MLDNVFGLPVMPVADRIIARLTEQQASQIDFFQNLIHNSISLALEDPSVVEGWKLVSAGASRQPDFVQLVIPFDYSAIPMDQRSYILNNIQRSFTNEAKTHKITLGFGDAVSEIIVSIEEA